MLMIRRPANSTGFLVHAFVTPLVIRVRSSDIELKRPENQRPAARLVSGLGRQPGVLEPPPHVQDVAALVDPPDHAPPDRDVARRAHIDLDDLIIGFRDPELSLELFHPAPFASRDVSVAPRCQVGDQDRLSVDGGAPFDPRRVHAKRVFEDLVALPLFGSRAFQTVRAL
jgi:hypothetical protein